MCDFFNETKFVSSYNLIAGVHHLNLTLRLNQFQLIYKNKQG